MSVHAIITNELARAVGKVADRHPECAVQIDWHEDSDERIWHVVATDGVTDHCYVIDDESGAEVASFS